MSGHLSQQMPHTAMYMYNTCLSQPTLPCFMFIKVMGDQHMP